MSSVFDFGVFILCDDILLCGTTDHSLSLPTIAQTCNVIDRSVTISLSQQICHSTFIMAQHTDAFSLLPISKISEESSARPSGDATPPVGAIFLIGDAIRDETRQQTGMRLPLKLLVERDCRF
jgi:hypothetical protein